MKNKILMISLVAVLALSVSLVACTGEGPTVELELIFSEFAPPGTATALAMVAYGNYFEDHSDGKIETTVYTGGELYSDAETFGAVKSGAIDCGAYVAEIGDGMYYIQVLTLPFMGYPNQEREDEIFELLCSNHSEIIADFTAQNVTYILGGVMPEVHFHYYAQNLTVDEPGDLDGYTMLVLEGDIAIQIEYIPGVSAVQTDFPGLFAHLEAGTGEGYVQHVPFLVSVVGFDYLYSHTLFPGGIRMVPTAMLWNTASYEACLDIVGQEVMDAADEVYASTFYLNDASITEDFWSAAIARGDTFTALNSTQLVPFYDLLYPYHQDWIDDAPNPTVAQAIYDDALALIAAS